MSERDAIFDLHVRTYDRNDLARYFASQSGMSVNHEAYMIRKIVQAGGHAGLIDLLRDMHSDDPGDRFIRAALFAEERALRISAAMLASFPAEIAELEATADPEVLKNARAA